MGAKTKTIFKFLPRFSFKYLKYDSDLSFAKNDAGSRRSLILYENNLGDH